MSPFRMSKIEEAMRVVLAFNQAFKDQDLDGMMEMVSSDCIFESADPAPNGARYTGKEAIRQYWQDLFHQNPQMQFKIEDVFSMGNRCIRHWRYQADEAEEQKGFIRGVDIVEVENGLICEIFSYVKGSFNGG